MNKIYQCKCKVDKYIEEIQEKERLNEVDPITIGGIYLGITALIFIKGLIEVLFFASMLRKTTKPNKEITKMVNDAYKEKGSNKTWSVNVVKNKDPNAFAITGSTVWTTSGLYKLLNTREVVAVALHECGHVENKDVFKRIAADSPLRTGVIGVAIAAAVATGIPFISLLVFSILIAISDTFLAHLQGRPQESAADSHAAYMGYRDEMISALEKIQQYVDRLSSRRECGAICQFVTKLSEFMDEHPPIRKRIEDLLKQPKFYRLSQSNNKKEMFKFAKDFLKVKEPVTFDQAGDKLEKLMKQR